MCRVCFGIEMGVDLRRRNGNADTGSGLWKFELFELLLGLFLRGLIGLGRGRVSKTALKTKSSHYSN